MLKRLGAAGASVSIGAVSGSAAATGVLAAGTAVDVSDVSGKVPLDEVADDPVAVTTGLGESEPTDVSVLVAAETDVIRGDVSTLTCCRVADFDEECTDCSAETCRVIAEWDRTIRSV